MRNEILEALMAIQRQGEQLLLTLDDFSYATPLPEAFDASIGAHYRHHLDHVDAWLYPKEEGIMDYDARERDPRLEMDKGAARTKTLAQAAACERLAADRMNQPVLVRCSVAASEGNPAPLVASSFGREAVNVVLHAVHHYAIIRMMCRIRNIPLPDAFGVAPATIQYRRGLATAGKPGN